MGFHESQAKQCLGPPCWGSRARGGNSSGSTCAYTPAPELLSSLALKKQFYSLTLFPHLKNGKDISTNCTELSRYSVREHTGSIPPSAWRVTDNDTLALVSIQTHSPVHGASVYPCAQEEGCNGKALSPPPTLTYLQALSNNSASLHPTFPPSPFSTCLERAFPGNHLSSPTLAHLKSECWTLGRSVYQWSC